MCTYIAKQIKSNSIIFLFFLRHFQLKQTKEKYETVTMYLEEPLPCLDNFILCVSDFVPEKCNHILFI